MARKQLQEACSLAPPVALSLNTKLGYVSQNLLHINARLQLWLRWRPDWRGEWRQRRGRRRGEWQRRRGDWLMRGCSKRCSRRCWHKLVNALQCLRLIVPRMVCPLCRCLNQAMDLMLMDLHMHEAQATTTLVVLRMFEIEYGCHLDALWTTTWT
ncbi:hypothetical protein VPH35_051605 [Triticum aestivum]